MAYTDGPFYLRSTGSDQTPAQIKKLDTAAGAAANDTTICDAGTDTTRRSFLVKPLQTNTTSAAIADNQGFGWKINSADMSSAANATRFIPSGIWTTKLFAFSSSLQTGVGGDDTDFTVKYHKVASDGSRSILFTDTLEAQALNPRVLADLKSISVSHVRVDFDIDETLEIEIWLTFPGKLVTGQTITVTVESNVAAEKSDYENPGIRTLYKKTLAAGTATVTPIIVKQTRKTLAASSSVSPVLSRRISLFRTLTQTANVTAVLNKKSFKTLSRTIIAASKGYVRIPFEKVPGGGLLELKIYLEEMMSGSFNSCLLPPRFLL